MQKIDLNFKITLATFVNPDRIKRITGFFDAFSQAYRRANDTTKPELDIIKNDIANALDKRFIKIKEWIVECCEWGWEDYESGHSSNAIATVAKALQKSLTDNHVTVLSKHGIELILFGKKEQVPFKIEKGDLPKDFAEKAFRHDQPEDQSLIFECAAFSKWVGNLCTNTEQSDYIMAHLVTGKSTRSHIDKFRHKASRFGASFGTGEMNTEYLSRTFLRALNADKTPMTRPRSEWRELVASAFIRDAGLRTASGEQPSPVNS